MAFKHHLVLPAHQVGVDQRQTGGCHALAHGDFALIAFADVKRRGVDDGQQFSACGFGICGRGIKPGVFTDQQAHFQLGTRRARLKHAGLIAGREVAALVKHLVIGQLALGVGGNHLPFAQHTGRVKALLHRHRAGAAVAARGMPDHDRQVFQVGQGCGDRFHGIITGMNECGTQKQIFGGIAANRQLGGQHQPGAVGIGLARGLDDFLGIARQITHQKIELCNAQCEGHGVSLFRVGAGLQSRAREPVAPCLRIMSFGSARRRTQVDPAAWDALLLSQANPSPFMRHAYLAALDASGSACPRTGWAPHFILLERDGVLQAACVVYAKTHSYGEYVFDWAWANAYAQHGLDYYPKAVVAVPFTPVPSTRLLAVDAAARAALVKALLAWCQDQQMSSLHLLFGEPEDMVACEAAGMMLRHTVQFHWKNAPHAYASFDDFLATLSQDKRKKIRQERRKVQEAGVSFRCVEGSKHQPSRLGFLLPLLRAHLPGARQRALPDAGLLPPHGQPLARGLGDVHCRARWPPDCYKFDSCPGIFH